MHFIKIFAERTFRYEEIPLVATWAFIKGNTVESAIGKHSSGAKSSELTPALVAVAQAVFIQQR